MQNELVQKATRLALVVALILSFVDVATKVACRLIVNVLLVLNIIDVGYVVLV